MIQNFQVFNSISRSSSSLGISELQVGFQWGLAPLTARAEDVNCQIGMYVSVACNLGSDFISIKEGQHRFVVKDRFVVKRWQLLVTREIRVNIPLIPCIFS